MPRPQTPNTDARLVISAARPSLTRLTLMELADFFHLLPAHERSLGGTAEMLW